LGRTLKLQQLGFTTWQNIGNYLNNEFENINPQIADDSQEVIAKIISLMPHLMQ
jgi:hypothetical protein